MNKLIYTVLIAFIAVFSLNCQKEISGNLNPAALPDKPSPIVSDVQGTIFDETEQPAPGVTVKIGQKSVTTDAKGFFRINDAPLDKLNSLITAEKAGYFKGIKSFHATSGTNNIMIKLLKKNSAGTIDVNTGGAVSLSNGAKISLPANGVINAQTNMAYTGTVTVYAAYIDPTAKDIVATVPGSFNGTDKDNKKVILSSYGMMAVELVSATGEKLQIATGKTASLTTPIPTSIQPGAPATIPLWYLDESTGIWKEEGTATKNGNVYTGEVKHFSYWNCDFPGPRVTLTAKFINPTGQALTGFYVRVRPANNAYQWYAYGNIDSLGQVSGEIPAGIDLVLEVVNYWQSGYCQYLLYSQNIGPYTSNIDLGTITVHPSAANQLTIKGKLVSCAGTPLANQYAAITYGYYHYYIATDANGNFSYTTWACDPAPATVEVYGTAGAEQSPTAIVPIQIPVTDAGTLTVCGISTNQYVNYTLDGTSYSHTTTSGDSFNGQRSPNQVGASYPYFSWLGVYTQTVPNANIYWNLNHDITAGAYPISGLSVRNLSRIEMSAPFDVTLTNSPVATGNYYEGNFSGQFKDSSDLTQVHTINCSFRIKRSL